VKLGKILSEQRGAVAITIAILAVVLLSFAALVIDIGYGLVVKNQLHNVADAAALAGTSCLGTIYAGGSRPVCGTYAAMSYTEQQSYVLTPAHRAAIVDAVQDAAQKNAAGGLAISINEEDIRIGDWDVPTRTLTVTDTHPTAVEVIARRDGSANGPITTFLANIMGVSSLSVRATSIRNGQQEEPTAALTGVGNVGPGAITIPIGISEKNVCEAKIFLGDTKDSCAGWTSFGDPFKQQTVTDYVNGAPSPALCVGCDNDSSIPQYGSIEFGGGTMTPLYEAMKTQYDAHKDEAGEWEVVVPVYAQDTAACENPNTLLSVVGFATVVITRVEPTGSEKGIYGRMECGLVEPGRGGGADMGTLGSIPGLVR
jgi:Flp pilus assembly protein TadG